ncbi:hypothetical protein NN561_005513 [Cricetulus griseus]
MAAIAHHNKGPRPGGFFGPTRQKPPPGFRGYGPQSPARPRCLSGPESENVRKDRGCPSSPAAGCPAGGRGLPGCSAHTELPFLPQRSPGTRGHRSGDAKTVAEEGGGPGGHSPAQTSGGRGGWQPGALRTPLSLPLLLADGLLPSVWIRQTTSLLATRPGSAGSRGRRNRWQRPEPPVTPPSEHARVALATCVGGGRLP